MEMSSGIKCSMPRASSAAKQPPADVRPQTKELVSVEHKATGPKEEKFRLADPAPHELSNNDAPQSKMLQALQSLPAWRDAATALLKEPKRSDRHCSDEEDLMPLAQLAGESDACIGVKINEKEVDHAQQCSKRRVIETFMMRAVKKAKAKFSASTPPKKAKSLSAIEIHGSDEEDHEGAPSKSEPGKKLQYNYSGVGGRHNARLSSSSGTTSPVCKRRKQKPLATQPVNRTIKHLSTEARRRGNRFRYGTSLRHSARFPSKPDSRRVPPKYETCSIQVPVPAARLGEAVDKESQSMPSAANGIISKLRRSLIHEFVSSSFEKHLLAEATNETDVLLVVKRWENAMQDLQSTVRAAVNIGCRSFAVARVLDLLDCVTMLVKWFMDKKNRDVSHVMLHRQLLRTLSALFNLIQIGVYHDAGVCHSIALEIDAHSRLILMVKEDQHLAEKFVFKIAEGTAASDIHELSKAALQGGSIVERLFKKKLEWERDDNITRLHAHMKLLQTTSDNIAAAASRAKAVLTVSQPSVAKQTQGIRDEANRGLSQVVTVFTYNAESAELIKTKLAKCDPVTDEIAQSSNARVIDKVHELAQKLFGDMSMSAGLEVHNSKQFEGKQPNKVFEFAMSIRAITAHVKLPCQDIVRDSHQVIAAVVLSDLLAAMVLEAVSPSRLALSVRCEDLETTLQTKQGVAGSASASRRVAVELLEDKHGDHAALAELLTRMSDGRLREWALEELSAEEARRVRDEVEKTKRELEMARALQASHDAADKPWRVLAEEASQFLRSLAPKENAVLGRGLDILQQSASALPLEGRHVGLFATAARPECSAQSAQSPPMAPFLRPKVTKHDKEEAA